METLHPITVKRLMGDLKKFKEAKMENFKIYPNPENMLEIYFLMKGQKGTLYENGEYLGKILHHKEYPKKAPDYIMLTPNGRFHINNKICLTNSAYHQGDWAPAAWNLVTLLEGFSSIWHSEVKEDKVGIGHISSSNEEIKEFAEKSRNFNNSKYSEIMNKFV
jgi:ubiquitin-protein ligase